MAKLYAVDLPSPVARPERPATYNVDSLAAAPIPGYEGATITARGVVFADGRTFYPKEEQSAKGWVSVVRFVLGGKRRRIEAGRAVARAWLPEPPAHCRLAYIDGDRGNPRADNLEWRCGRDVRRGRIRSDSGK